jgi:hypothetical protein
MVSLGVDDGEVYLRSDGGARQTTPNQRLAGKRRERWRAARLFFVAPTALVVCRVAGHARLTVLWAGVQFKIETFKFQMKQQECLSG